MEAWQLVGCGPASGCIGCPPTTEEQRLYFFTCEEVAAEDGGAAAEEQPQMIGPLSVPRPFAGVGMVDSLMPQWDKTGGNWEIMPEDLRMVAEYEAWLPDKIFDARPLFTRPRSKQCCRYGMEVAIYLCWPTKRTPLSCM